MMESSPVYCAWRGLVVVLFWACALLNAYFVLTLVLGDAPAAAFLLVPALMGGFSLTHAIHRLGLYHALAFFGLATIISLVFEAVGVATGTIYGPYHYTGSLGPKLFKVPQAVPMAWFMVVYPSYTLVNYLADGHVISKPKPEFARLVGLAALSAILSRPALALVVFFAMGTPCLAALLRGNR